MAQRPRAYSYLRFSHPDQSRGDSARRQTTAAQEYAERHGLELDDKLTFRDLGVSAFHGANALEGALGQFITAVDAGRVPRGSYLLVENLDRLSRDKIMRALNLFSSLLEKGITIATLSDGKVYTAASLNNIADLIMSLLVMSRAHEESDLKSRRVRAAWQNKRERAANGGHVLTARAPAWLRFRDGSFELIEDRAAIVRRIFALALEGHGKVSIARQLNREGVAPFGDGPSQARKADGWHPSYVRKIIENEAVIGRYQPMRRVWIDGKKHREADGPVIEGYFPPVLHNPDDFYRARRATGASGYKGRALANILSGLVACPACGGRMHFINKGPPPKGGAYLACDNARRKGAGTCEAKAVRYSVVATAILSCLEDGELDFRSLLAQRDDRRGELRARLEATIERIAEAESSIANLLGVLERRPSAVVEKRLADHEATLAQLREDKGRLDRELREVSADADQVGDVIDTVKKLNKILASGDPDAISAVLVKVNAALKRIISRIEVSISDDAQRWLGSGIRWADRRTKDQALPTPVHRRAYASIVEKAPVSIGVGFHAEGRHLVIAADRKRPGRFAAGAVHTNAKGRIEDFTLKLWSI